MIPLWIGKMVAKGIIKGVKHRIDLKKIDKYVNNPNELDIQVKQLQKNNSKLLKENEEMQKDIALLKKDSHPSQEFICCKKCGCKINKTKKRR